MAYPIIKTILTKLKKWNGKAINQTKNNAIFDKPWVRDKEFNRSDVKGDLHVVYQNGLYIDKSNLTPRLENRIRQLALLSNPNFYKKQALGLSNYKRINVEERILESKSMINEVMVKQSMLVLMEH